jgi:excinuclease ABC subunit A
MREGIPHPLRKSRRILSTGKKKSDIRTWLELSDVHYRNLNGVSVLIPTECLVVVCGVSGSGKSSLIRGILKKGVGEATEKKAKVVRQKNYKLTNGNCFNKVIEVTQSPIGKTSRSTPATYLGVWDHIRKLMANLPEAKAKGLTASDFSFNVKGGRCEACKGVGKNKVEMNFLPDSYVVCQECKGLRYRHEILELKWNGKSIADILDLNFAEAESFFHFDHFLKSTFGIMIETGLEYLKLGQVSPTLSGGEAQRLKLGAELASGIDKRKYTHRPQAKPNLYILEEPTIGLHTKDCKNLILLLHRLIDEGNTVILIEHDIDLIAEADYLIELGPVGGNEGGRLLHQGTVKQMLTNKKSKTAPFLQKLGQLG